MRRGWFAMVAVGGAAAILAWAGAAAAAPGQSQEGSGQTEPTKAQRYYMSGSELMANFRYLDAAEQFRLAIDEDPKYIDAYKNLAFVYTKMAESESEYYEDALEIYRELEDMLPDDVEIKKNKAYVYAALEELDDAVATYDDILKLTPEDCTAWGRLGELHLSIADKASKESPEHAPHVDQAVAAYTRITEVCPEEMYAYNKLGEIYYAADRVEEAAGVYAKLLQRDADNVEVTGRLGYIWYKAGKDADAAKNEEASVRNFEKAVPLFEKLLELDPSRSNYRALYAESLKKVKRFEDSADQYLKIIKEDPAKKDLYCNVGFIYIDAKRQEKAIEAAMTAIADNAPQAGCLNCVWAKGLEMRGTEQVQNYEFDRGIATYGEAKIKFTLAQGDKQFGDYATKQISRLDQLIERAKQMKLKYDEEMSRRKN